MSFSYSAYGLHLCSNLPIFRLSESPSSSFDVYISLGQLPAWFNESLKSKEDIFYVSPSGEDEQGIPRVIVRKSPAKSYFRFQYADGAEFLIDEPGTQVWGIWPDKLTLEDALVYLIGPIMGFVLRQRGFTSLHASAVVVDNRAVAIMGPPGAGKSTTAAAFARLGYSVVSDDIVPLLSRGNAFAVQSGYPCVCLWPKSVKSLYGSADALPLLTPTWDKRYLPLGDETHRFQSAPLPLAAIYILGRRDTDPASPFVEPASAGQALISLISNTYMNYLLDSELRAREFDLLGRLVGTVPVRKVQPYDDPAYLTRLCELIVEDVRNLGSSAELTLSQQDKHA